MIEEAAVIEQNQPAVVPEPTAAPPEPRVAFDMAERLTTAPGGDTWDGEKWVNGVERDAKERDSQGRFAAVRKSLEQAQKESQYRRLVLDGAVSPTDEMDEHTWLAARNAQIASGVDRITTPDFPTEKAENADGANQPSAQPETLTEEDVRHIESHNSMLATVASKMVIDNGATQAAMNGLGIAHERFGVPVDALNYMGHCIADCPNAHEVFLAVGKKPEVIAAFSQLAPQGMRAAILRISQDLSDARAKPRETRAPAPPDPVGARPVVAAFDVNDENMTADEWRERREQQLRKNR